MDPSRERTATRFRSVPRTLGPLHAAARSDRVEREREARVTRRSETGGRGEVRPFPTAFPGPAADS